MVCSPSIICAAPSYQVCCTTHQLALMDTYNCSAKYTCDRSHSHSTRFRRRELLPKRRSMILEEQRPRHRQILRVFKKVSYYGCACIYAARAILGFEHGSCCFLTGPTPRSQAARALRCVSPEFFRLATDETFQQRVNDCASGKMSQSDVYLDTAQYAQSVHQPRVRLGDANLI